MTKFVPDLGGTLSPKNLFHCGEGSPKTMRIGGFDTCVLANRYDEVTKPCTRSSFVAVYLLEKVLMWFPAVLEGLQVVQDAGWDFRLTLAPCGFHLPAVVVFVGVIIPYPQNASR